MSSSHSRVLCEYSYTIAVPVHFMRFLLEMGRFIKESYVAPEEDYKLGLPVADPQFVERGAWVEHPKSKRRSVLKRLQLDETEFPTRNLVTGAFQKCMHITAAKQGLNRQQFEDRAIWSMLKVSVLQPTSSSIHLSRDPASDAVEFFTLYQDFMLPLPR
ncbi:unnamed protein product [Amoebophrya sp. A25]|nr:unnamed protein product [Amoebophrya sp. A25]|eukprot:GSA25T00011223001.1